MTAHQFGGSWTEDKLARLRKYLSAYTTIFKANKRAAFLRTTYVDAFAGTGYRMIGRDNNQVSTFPLLDDVYNDEETQSFQKGSAYIAIETEPSFDQYLFIEKNPAYAQELEQLRVQFPQKSNQIRIVQGETNNALNHWCQTTDWQRNRAVVFLDPYGMEVEWTTIELIANTKAIDLWVLFPLGQAVNRLLTRDKPPEGAWADRLTAFFGTDDWKDAFYRPNPQVGLFDFEESIGKNANFEKISNYFLERLASVFEKVADNPLPLRNSRNVPIYLLCFASGNPKGAPTAVRIAQDILRR